MPGISHAVDPIYPARGIANALRRRLASPNDSRELSIFRPGFEPSRRRPRENIIIIIIASFAISRNEPPPPSSLYLEPSGKSADVSSVFAQGKYRNSSSRRCGLRLELREQIRASKSASVEASKII